MESEGHPKPRPESVQSSPHLRTSTLILFAQIQFGVPNAFFIRSLSSRISENVPGYEALQYVVFSIPQYYVFS